MKNEYELPPVVEDLVLLDYTPIEAILYKDYSEYAEMGKKYSIGFITTVLYVMVD